MRQIVPRRCNDILLNPGCGAMLLQRGDNKISFDQVPSDAWFLQEKLVDKIAFSIVWSQLEPEEGKFLWKQPDWEDCIDSWIVAGYKVALEVRGMGTWGTFYNDGVPQWVFDAGARYVDEPIECYRGDFTLNFLDFSRETAPVRYPVYWDPVYLEKVGNLIQVLGERYNGRSEIEFINNGFLGRWGEMHIAHHCSLKPWLDAGLSRASYLKAFYVLMEHMRRAFPDTRICQEICSPAFSEELGRDYICDTEVPEIYAYLAQHRMIIKHNGLGKAWNGMRSKYIDQSVLEIFDQYFRQTPVAGENLCLPVALNEAVVDGHISYWHPGGECEGLHILRHELPVPLAEKRIWSSVKFFPDEYAKLSPEDEKEVWRFMARHCGYRLEIEKIEIAGSLVAISWRNSGNAPCYEQLELELEASVDGNIVSALKCPVLADGLEKYRMPHEIPIGSELRLRLSAPRGAIELGIEGADPDRFYRWTV